MMDRAPGRVTTPRDELFVAAGFLLPRDPAMKGKSELNA
jgi:hypothetical protein